FGLRKILGKSESPTGVKNPCLIAKVLSKRTGIDDDLIGFVSRLKPTLTMRRGIDSPADLWVNAKTFECERFWVSPRVRQGLKTPVS
ncbi:MAG: hypothetical protein EAZ09_17055, partial [Oscillatoriales cyanobacterium]